MIDILYYNFFNFLYFPEIFYKHEIVKDYRWKDITNFNFRVQDLITLMFWIIFDKLEINHELIFWLEKQLKVCLNSMPN